MRLYLMQLSYPQTVGEAQIRPGDAIFSRQKNSHALPAEGYLIPLTRLFMRGQAL